MSKFIIEGGRKLNGRWPVQGGKNAATPVLAATLLTDEECVINNVPRISDVDQMLNILRMLGAKFVWQGNTVRIQTKKINTDNIDYKAFKRMRSSILFLGPLAARLPEFKILEPGGCFIGNRPLTAHFNGLRNLGAAVAEARIGKDAYYKITVASLRGGEVRLEEKSVTATENLLMAASLAKGRTIIKNAAQEPHVVCLAACLGAMGTKISGAGTDEITVSGAAKLNGTEFDIIPDQLEIGTIAVLGALTGGEVEIFPIISADMRVVLAKLRQAGVQVEEGKDAWLVRGRLSSLRAFNIATAPTPGFPTDLQAPFGLLATQAAGRSKIFDPMFDNRLGYLKELQKMGAKAEIIDKHTAFIEGPTSLSGAEIESLDLRAGATLIIAGLIASGQTILNGAEIIDRGYERIEERLAALGAEIKRLE